ncbi:uncharacterized protein [Cardiocondyla obscurior]|uniref:uncharacterized protein n=1 Tax=Cardiocondyla obscurior TaxID=286306 RepID=UPI0039658359
MQRTDPSNGWIQEAAQYAPEDCVQGTGRIDAEEGNPEDNVHEEDQYVLADEAATGTAGDLINLNAAVPAAQKESSLTRRERELDAREINILRTELELLRRENDALRASPRSSLYTSSRTTLSIRNVCELLSEFNGNVDNFERWKAQVLLLINMYELDENAARILVGSRLRGKAAEWYASLVEHLSMNVDDLLERMSSMFGQRLSRLERKRLFENRTWQRNETFENYCHDKVILGNKVPIEHEELIEYIIDGIPSATPETKQARKDVCYELKGKDKVNSRGSPVPRVKDLVRCYACNEEGHFAKDCPTSKKRPKKSEVGHKKGTKDAKTQRQVGLIDDAEKQPELPSGESEDEEQSEAESKIHLVDTHGESRDEFQRTVELKFKRKIVVLDCSVQSPGIEWKRYCGINNSKLIVKGTIKADVCIDGSCQTVTLGVVSDATMSVSLLIGRDTLTLFGYRLTQSPAFDKMEAKLILKEAKLVQFRPRRLGLAEKGKVTVILNNLVERGIIRKSTSEYASPIVLTRKKSGEIRMCVDYRALNKILARDNYPLPLIDDQLDMLREKQFYSLLDLMMGSITLRWR